ncbi:hypothetical protein IFR05_002728 [Cadophora sp. M221]|nr:hypothetical protein IFR05_002728 [Cadophora sp. M221]
MAVLSIPSESDLPQGVKIDSGHETGDAAVIAVFPKFKCIALYGIVREADPVRGLKRVEVRRGAVVVVDAVQKGTVLAAQPSMNSRSLCSTPFLHMIQCTGESYLVKKISSGCPLHIFDPTTVNEMNPVLAFPGMSSIRTEEQGKEIVELQSRPSNECN